MCARLWPYLTQCGAATHCATPLLKQKEIDPLDLHNLRSVKLPQGLTESRDRHGQARPIICVPFWALMSSLCVTISLFLPLPPFLLYRHRLWPVQKRADRFQGAHFRLKKVAQKQ